MTLPLAISLPHAGFSVPPEVADLCLLSREQIARDGDEGAREVYAGLEGEVAAFVDTPVGRAIVDPNRAPDDLRADGVVKTHTCFREPVYREPLAPDRVKALLERYYHPYHARLAGAARTGVELGVDCHTMLSQAPPIDAHPGRERPAICLSDGCGATCPGALVEALARCLERAFGRPVSRNDPFGGGYIVRRHAAELPWVQLELSRAAFASDVEKAARVRAALRAFCAGEGARA